MIKKQPQINKIGAKGDSCRFRGGGSKGLAPLTFAASLFNFYCQTASRHGLPCLNSIPGCVAEGF